MTVLCFWEFLLRDSEPRTELFLSHDFLSSFFYTTPKVYLSQLHLLSVSVLSPGNTIMNKAVNASRIFSIYRAMRLEERKWEENRMHKSSKDWALNIPVFRNQENEEKAAKAEKRSQWNTFISLTCLSLFLSPSSFFPPSLPLSLLSLFHSLFSLPSSFPSSLSLTLPLLRTLSPSLPNLYLSPKEE